MWQTKVGMRHSMFMIEECIQNYDTELSITKNTTIVLSKRGDSFFKAHVEYSDRYKQLVDVYTPFILRTMTRMRKMGLNKTS